MGMPSGESPAKAHQYYEYLQSHEQTMQAPATWHVHWLDLAWLWGFMIALSLIIIWWLWQYRSTRQRGIYPTDQFGGYTSEAAGPATRFFLLFTALVTGWAVVLLVGHIIWGQKF